MLYDLGAHVAQLYDQIIREAEDIGLIRRLIGSRKRLRILEPFCGTGRIPIPLAFDGCHKVEHMLGDYEGRPYTDSSPRAIFWARKTR